MKELRIALCGVSGSGKTTLMKKIAEKYDLPICPVGSRSVAASMGFENPYDTDKAGAREEFQHRLFEQKRHWESLNETFVSDRTHFDNLAYSMLHCPASVNQNRFDDMVLAMTRYTHVFYLPRASFQNLGGDPHRVQSTTYHEAHDLLLEGLLNRHFVSTYDFHVLGVPLEDRANTAFMFIDKHGQGALCVCGHAFSEHEGRCTEMTLTSNPVGVPAPGKVVASGFDSELRAIPCECAVFLEALK